MRPTDKELLTARNAEIVELRRAIADGCRNADKPAGRDCGAASSRAGAGGLAPPHGTRPQYYQHPGSCPHLA